MKHFLLFICITVFLASCAIMSIPDGGEKDILPPQILASDPPNKSVHFNAEEITITFDEYIAIQNFGTQFFSSPPLLYPVKQRIKGKKLILTLADTLVPNTTYTFSFGNSIKDISEGNVQSNYKYVFSTGDVLDSLKISGTITNAYTGLPEEGMIALLYRPDIDDSLIYNQKPNYYAISDKQGHFAIENLDDELFLIVAIKDENASQTYNPGLEKLAFKSDLIQPSEAGNVNLRAFIEKTDVRLIDSKQMGYGKIIFVFSEKVTQPEIAVIGGTADKKATEVVETNSTSDTISYWYNPTEYDKNLRELYFSVATKELVKDSVRVNLREQQPSPLKITTGTPSVFSKNDSLYFNLNNPILSLDASKITFKVDTVIKKVAYLQSDARKVVVDTKLAYNTTYQLTLSEGALVDIFGKPNDSTTYKLKSAAEDELAIVHLVIIGADFEPKIAELIDQKGKTVRTFFFTDRLVEDLVAMPPGKYGLRIIWDSNENKIWDAGNFLAKQQPEQVMYYPKPIELRANWEVETIWEMPDTTEPKD